MQYLHSHKPPFLYGNFYFPHPLTSLLLPNNTGMQYLHSRKPPVIHGDLRYPNLLLDMSLDDTRGPRFHVKIADFGLARCALGLVTAGGGGWG